MILAVIGMSSPYNGRYDACNFLTKRCASVTEVRVTRNLAVKENVLRGLVKSITEEFLNRRTHKGSFSICGIPFSECAILKFLNISAKRSSLVRAGSPPRTTVFSLFVIPARGPYPLNVPLSAAPDRPR